jgi:hypothetical protein
MPIELLAGAVVTKFLLPALEKGVDTVAGAISDQVGKQAAAHTEGLIGRLWAKVDGLFGGGSEREQDTLAAFRDEPEVYAGAVEKILQRKLEQDPATAAEIQRMIDEPVPGTSMTGAQVWNAAVAGVVDLRQANFSRASNVSISAVTIPEMPPPTPGPTARPDLP